MPTDHSHIKIHYLVLSTLLTLSVQVLAWAMQSCFFHLAKTLRLLSFSVRLSSAQYVREDWEATSDWNITWHAAGFHCPRQPSNTPGHSCCCLRMHIRAAVHFHDYSGRMRDTCGTSVSIVHAENRILVLSLSYYGKKSKWGICRANSSGTVSQNGSHITKLQEASERILSSNFLTVFHSGA